MVRFFYDPILRAPTIGSMLMCLTAGLVGVLLFARKRMLIGETLSHATYPGVTIGVIFAAALGFQPHSLCAQIGAFVSALVGFLFVEYLGKKGRVREDSALTLVLAAAFGVGVTVASYAQVSHTQAYQQMQSFLYGQAATMTDGHVLAYGLLTLFVIATLLIFYRSFIIRSFDPIYAKMQQMGSLVVRALFLLMVVLSVVIGIQGAGVILMSSMFIAPAIAARQYSDRLSVIFVLAALFSLISGFLGTVLSLQAAYPTGPMIVLVAGGIALFSLLFAPKRGWVMHKMHLSFARTRLVRFHLLNLLETKPLSYRDLVSHVGGARLRAIILLLILQREGVIEVKKGYYSLARKRGIA